MKNFIGQLIASLLFIKIIPGSDALTSIKIGAIFHYNDDHLEAAFDQAIKKIEAEQIYSFELKAVKRKNVERESFKAMKVACELIEEGVAALFGPTDLTARNAIASVAARFDIPYFEYSYRSKDDFLGFKGINIYPSSELLEKAIAEVVRHMNYQGYTYIYQGSDALARVQRTLENFGRQDYPITIRELPALSRLKEMLEPERNKVYETLIKEIHKSTQLSVLIDVETENLPFILSEMNKIGLMSDYFMSLVTNLDASTVDIYEFIPKNSIANITYFQFIDPAYNFSVEAALLYDSVFVFADALSNLYKEFSSSSSISSSNSGTNYEELLKLEPHPLSCHGEVKYKAGPNLTSMVFKKTKAGQSTGHLTFNDNKERDFALNIIQAGFKSKSGEWKNGELKLIRDEKELNVSFSESMKNKIFIVTTRVGSPYIMPSEDESEGRMIGDKRYQGYCIDLIAKIEQYHNIKCDFKLVPDNNYGSYNPYTKQWDGLIKQLLDRKADFAICDLTITSERQSAVDFTSPFMNLGISILFATPEQVEPEQFAFMKPFSADVWIMLATAYFGFSIILFFQAKFAPKEWMNPHPCNNDPEEEENPLNLQNSMWLTIGSLMQQGSDILPRSVSVRLLVLFWWFFILIMASSYTANLAAFLTAVKLEDNIEDIEDLAKQTKVSYGALKDGSTYSFFKNSNTSLYQRIFNTMIDANPSVFTKSNDDGVDRVLKGKRKYAFFMESTSIEYQIERHCELRQVGTLLDNKGYGIAMPPNSPYRTMISTAILHLQEKGELQQLKNKWWKEKGGGLCGIENNKPTNSNELGMDAVQGVFIVLIYGCIISSFVAIIQFCYNVRNKVMVEEDIPWREALVKEIKFFTKFLKNTKSVHPKRVDRTDLANSLQRLDRQNSG